MLLCGELSLGLSNDSFFKSWHISFCSKCTLMYFCHILDTFNNIRKGKYARFMKMFIEQIMQEIKRLNKSPVTLNGIRTWWCQFLARGRGSLHLPCVWLQMISETRRTSVETHFMSTVRADNFLGVLSSFTFTFTFQSTVFFANANLLLLLLIPFLILLPPSGSRLQLPLTAVNQTMCVSFFFFIPNVNRALKKLTALRGCCFINALLS